MLDFELLNTMDVETDVRDVDSGFAIRLSLDKLIQALVAGSTCASGEIDEGDAQAWSCLLRGYANEIDAMPRISTAYPRKVAA
jgi:hypothetical protein